MRGRSGQSGLGKTRWEGEGAGAERPPREGARRGGEKLQPGRSERPWEDCGAPSPTPPGGEASGNFPAQLVL